MIKEARTLSLARAHFALRNTPPCIPITQETNLEPFPSLPPAAFPGQTWFRSQRRRRESSGFISREGIMGGEFLKASEPSAKLETASLLKAFQSGKLGKFLALP